GMLQAVVIIALIAKLVGVMAFQGRLGIICRTLMTMAGPISHLVLLLVLVLVMLAAANNTVIGYRVGATSSLSAALADSAVLLVGSNGMDFGRLVANGLILPSVERVAVGAIVAVQVLLMLYVLVNFFFATMSHLFLKQKHIVDWENTPSLLHDLLRVVLPDMVRALVSVMPGAAARRRRRLAASLAAARQAAVARPAADTGVVMDARKPSTEDEVEMGRSGGSCDNSHAPTNRQLLRTLAAGGIDERLLAVQLPKTWNGRVRAALVAGGRSLIDKPTMRQVMCEVAATSAPIQAKLVDDSDDDVRGSSSGSLRNRVLALIVARRVMDRVGRTYGAGSLEFRALEAAAEARTERQRLGGGVAGAAAVCMADERSRDSAAERSSDDSSGAPLRHSLSAEIQIHLTIYEALHAAVESIVRWQSGVHRWQ
ncbi:hypothetical protein Agub_g9277, partial [Astrephomene gubernaculifera]